MDALLREAGKENDMRDHGRHIREATADGDADLGRDAFNLDTEIYLPGIGTGTLGEWLGFGRVMDPEGAHAMIRLQPDEGAMCYGCRRGDHCQPRGFPGCGCPKCSGQAGHD